MSKPKYDSTVARIAGNILSARPFTPWTDMSGDVVLTDADKEAMQWAVLMAREIVAEVNRTEPPMQARESQEDPHTPQEAT